MGGYLNQGMRGGFHHSSVTVACGLLLAVIMARGGSSSFRGARQREPGISSL
jgi:hypothetical protein